MTEVNSQLKLLEVPANALLQTDITLPVKVDYSEKVGQNKISRIFPQQTLSVDVYTTSKKSVYEVRIGAKVLFLRLDNSKTDCGANGTLKAEGILDISDLNADTKLKWLHFNYVNEQDPNKIADSWENQLSFVEENRQKAISGLRKPQLGAIHAIKAHWSVSDECATVVMPTGTGKTETMLATLVSGKCPKVLVVVPSKTLRRQLHDKFVSLGKLRQIGVLDVDVLNPKVGFIDHGIKTIEEASQLAQKSNVLIATASALAQASEAVLEKLCEGCTHLFLDEAHHAPADTWRRIREAFGNKPILQFTATPFRRDAKPIEGKIVYNYPLGLAQKEQYFKKINLVKLQEFDDEIADEAIATNAVKALREDIDQGYEHILMARCSSKKRAEEVLEVYERIAPDLNPIKIDSELSATKYNEVENKLRAGSIKIIVCVNMLGEGFDLSALKIAAIHDSHKSLAVTLQFVGRFTRIEDKVGDATVVVNINEPKVNKDLEELYSDNADWNELLKEKSESTIETEIESHEFVGQFSGELSEHVSLWNLRPSFSTIIYETGCTNWKPEKFAECIPESYKYWYATNQTSKVLVIVISRDEEVKWGKYKDIFNHSFDLCVLYWDEEKGAVYVNSSDYDAINPTKLAKLVCGETTELKNGSRVFNIYSGVDRILARNLGVSTIGNISYTMHFGSDVTTGMSSIDRAEGSLNNVYAWGYEGGDRFDGGCSSRSGKVWSVGGGAIIDWREWCRKMGDKVFDDELPDSEIIKDFLKPTRIERRYEAVALSIQWSENILKARESNVTVSIGEKEYKLFEVDIELTDHSNNGDIRFRVLSDNKETKYKLSYSPRGCTYTKISGEDVLIRKNSKSPIKLEEYAQKDPVVIFYADGSYSWNNFHVPTPALSSFFDDSKLKPIDWTGVNKKVESMGQDGDENSVQFRTTQEIIDDYEVVFNDDNSGEAADLIAIRKDDNDTLRLRLVHCKYTKAKNKGSRVDDFYELCGQAQKSIRWKHNGFEYLYEHMKKRDDTWAVNEKTRFIKGDLSILNKLRKFARYAPNLVFEVTLVQPGLDSTKVSDDVRQLLGSTEDYLLKTSNAIFEVICD